ncbi:MAG: hypothetical protein M0T72_11590 [Candidatus Dormibacteraeota bacterium]|nr:hypothetical protein [Candidatus Dormibacteraeota bacterium]
MAIQSSPQVAREAAAASATRAGCEPEAWSARKSVAAAASSSPVTARAQWSTICRPARRRSASADIQDRLRACETMPPVPVAAMAPAGAGSRRIARTAMKVASDTTVEIPGSGDSGRCAGPLVGVGRSVRYRHPGSPQRRQGGAADFGESHPAVVMHPPRHPVDVDHSLSSPRVPSVHDGGPGWALTGLRPG